MILNDGLSSNSVYEPLSNVENDGMFSNAVNDGKFSNVVNNGFFSS